MPTGDRIDGFLAKWKAWIAAGCCLFGAVRVLAFAAAYPLFNPVDEPAHYEMVYEYSRGRLPGAELYKSDPEIARVATLYGSSEYYRTREVLQNAHRDMPISLMPAGLKNHFYGEVYDFWSRQSNIETQSPAIYYLVAAGWLRFGELFGARDWRLAYWVRFLNAILYGAFVWVAYLFLTDVYPERAFLCAGAPLLLAVFPQDVFYGVNRDVLSPLLVAVFLLLLFRGLRADSGGYWELLLAGVLAGVAFLTDISNFVLFGVLAPALLIKSKRLGKARGGGQARIAMALLAALGPPVLWMARNRVVMGDLTGSQAKIFYLGWVEKPWAEIWHHPIFSLPGAWYFTRELIGSFWRGEIAWAGQPLRNSSAEVFYLYSTMVIVAAFVSYFATQRREQSGPQRINGYASIFLLGASVAFMAALSLLFDFQQCPYPSRARPYFVSGRIIIGTLLPFVVMYLSGFEFLLRPVRKYVHPIIPLLALCAAQLCVELALASSVFHSHFNFYALSRA
jgi:hypothetical protein